MPKKVDANQKQITEQLRKIPGISVWLTHELGKGAPDMVVGYRGINLLVEIKDSEKPKSQRKLTPDEKKFHQNWKGKIIVAQTLEDIVHELKLTFFIDHKNHL